jgi:hypothetical protein
VLRRPEIPMARYTFGLTGSGESHLQIAGTQPLSTGALEAPTARREPPANSVSSLKPSAPPIPRPPATITGASSSLIPSAESSTCSTTRGPEAGGIESRREGTTTSPDPPAAVAGSKTFCPIVAVGLGAGKGEQPVGLAAKDGPVILRAPEAASASRATQLGAHATSSLAASRERDRGPNSGDPGGSHAASALRRAG